MDDFISIVNFIVMIASYVTGVFLVFQVFGHIKQHQTVPYILLVSAILAFAFPTVLSSALNSLGYGEQAQYASIPAKMK